METSSGEIARKYFKLTTATAINQSKEELINSGKLPIFTQYPVRKITNRRDQAVVVDVVVFLDIELTQRRRGGDAVENRRRKYQNEKSCTADSHFPLRIWQNDSSYRNPSIWR